MPGAAYPEIEALSLLASDYKSPSDKHVKSYSTDIRRQFVRAYQCRLGSQRALADAFGVSPSFMKKVLRRYRRTGQLTPKLSAGGQKPRLDEVWCSSLPRFKQLLHYH